jgi:hypothetical protein
LNHGFGSLSFGIVGGSVYSRQAQCDAAFASPVVPAARSVQILCFIASFGVIYRLPRIT